MRSLYDALTDHRLSRNDLAEALDAQRNSAAQHKEAVIQAQEELVASRRVVDEVLIGVNLERFIEAAHQYRKALEDSERVLIGSHRSGCKTYDPNEFFGSDSLKQLRGIMHQLDISDEGDTSRKMHDFILRGGEYYVRNDYLWASPEMKEARRIARTGALRVFLATSAAGMATFGLSAILEKITPEAFGISVVATPIVSLIGSYALSYRHGLHEQMVYNPFSRMSKEIEERVKTIEEITAGL